MKEKNKGLALDIASLVLSVVLCAGVKLVFHACAPHEDGSFMSCHWAEQAVFAFGCALVVQNVVALVVDRHGVKSGVYLAATFTALFAMWVPRAFISLCMMNTMRCHIVMRPATVVVSALCALVSAFDFFVHYRQCGKRHAQAE